VLLNILILSVLGYRKIFLEKGDLYAWALYAVLLLWLASRAWRLKRRVADLVIAAAGRGTLQRVYGKASKPAPTP
jgi:hypothetical protein